MKTHSKNKKWSTVIKVDNINEFIWVAGTEAPAFIENLIHTLDDHFYNENEVVEIPHGKNDFCFRFRVISLSKYEDETGNIYLAEYVLTFCDFILTTYHE